MKRFILIFVFMSIPFLGISQPVYGYTIDAPAHFDSYIFPASIQRMPVLVDSLSLTSNNPNTVLKMFFGRIIENSYYFLDSIDKMPSSLIYGLAQIMHTDTIQQIGGVSLVYSVSCSDTTISRNNTGDSIFIIDLNDMQTIYAKELNDTFAIVSNITHYGVYHEIIFDSAIEMRNDYLIGYKYNNENIFNTDTMNPYPTSQDFIYRETRYRLPLAILSHLMPYPNGLPMDQIDYYNYLINIFQSGNQDLVYYYDNSQGWITCKDYKVFNGIDYISIQTPAENGSYFLYQDIPATPDLAMFSIPESAIIDSIDRPWLFAQDTIPTDTTITDSTDTNFLSQIDLERMIAVQPNPTKGEVVISCPEPLREVALLNPMGQVLYRENYNQKRITLNLSSYPQGVYILHLQTPSGEVRKKIIRQ